MNKTYRKPTPPCHIEPLGEVSQESQKDSVLKDISATPQYDNAKIDNDFMEFHQGKICFADKYIVESESITTIIKKDCQKGFYAFMCAYSCGNYLI